MPAPANAFAASLAACAAEGRAAFGCWLGLADAYAAEIAATAGFDWLLIDGEHAPNDLRSMSAQLGVLSSGPAAPLLRLPAGEAWMVKQALDLGAQTLLVPMVESAAQAAALGRAMRYPPAGVRGVGSALARASRFSAIEDYLPSANAEVRLVVQVESRAALAELDAIVAAEGVDAVFVGPSDLAADMGRLGHADAPEVKAAVLDALARIAAGGKPAGVMALDPGFSAECVAAGASFVAVAIDVLTLAGGLREAARRYTGRA